MSTDVHPWRRRFQVVVAGALLSVVVFTAFNLNTSTVNAAPNRPEDFHCQVYYCYGSATWNGANGAITNITTVAFTCNGCVANSQQIINALWLYGDLNQWVEAGYMLPFYYSDECNGECYYWADKTLSNGFNPHALGGVPSSNYGTPVYVQIYRLDSSDWRIDVAGYGGHGGTGKSTSNDMNDQQISIGEELAADSRNQYVFAPEAHFTGNEWQSERDGHWHWQATDVNAKQSLPPYAYWWTTPSHSSTGGDLIAYCC